MAGYTRYSSYEDGFVTLDSYTNNEFNGLQEALSKEGHSHDGSVGEGFYVPTLSNDTLSVSINTEGTQGIYFEDILKFDGATASLDVVFPSLHNTNLELLETTVDVSLSDTEVVNRLHTVTNEFTSAEKDKLDGIQKGASRDQSKASLRRLLTSNTDTNVLSTSLLSKLNKMEPKIQTFSFSKEIKFIDPTVSLVQVRILREGSTRRSKVIHVKTVEDTAVSPTHFTAIDTDVTFNQGVSYVDIPLTVVPGAYSTGLVFSMELTDVDTDISTVVSDVPIELVIQPTAEGGAGTPGPKGDAGEDGKDSYIHTAYAENDDGTLGFSLTNTVDKTYLGVYSSFDETPSTEPSFYTWQLVKGNVGDTGETGETGPSGVRGSNLLYIEGTVWSDSVATNLLTSTYGNVVEWDSVTISDDTTGFSQTRYWDGTSWVILEKVIDGNLLVTESIRGKHISSGTTIIAGAGNAQAGINGFDSGIYS